MSYLGDVGLGALFGGPGGAGDMGTLDFASSGNAGPLSGLWDAFTGKSAGDAQQAIAMAQLNQAKQTQNQALSYAKPSDGELQAMKGQLDLYAQINTLNQENLKQQTALAQAINPNIIEAAKQAYQLMTGGSSAATAGVMGQRNQQRRALEDSLAAKLGSGYATSTAGMQALNQFDNQSQQLQFGMMGSLLQYSGQFNPNMGQQIAQAGSSTSGALMNYSNTANAMAGRQISALEGTNITPYAGANNISALVQGQTGQALTGQVFGAALSYGGMAAGSQSAMARNPYAQQQYYQPQPNQVV